MAGPLIDIITSADPKIRNQPLDAFCVGASADELLAACAELDAFHRRSDNLYERVRALLFLYAIHRFHLPGKLPAGAEGMIPFKGFEHLLHRRFEEALDRSQRRHFQRPGGGLSAAGLSDAGGPGAPQRARRAGQPMDVPHGPPGRSSVARIRPELLQRGPDGTYPMLRECTPVRMDLTTAAGATSSSSAWIFPKARGA
jgi:hypothetical protein